MTGHPTSPSRQKPGVDPLECRELLSGMFWLDGSRPIPAVAVEFWARAPFRNDGVPNAQEFNPGFVHSESWQNSGHAESEATHDSDGGMRNAPPPPPFVDHHERAASAIAPAIPSVSPLLRRSQTSPAPSPSSAARHELPSTPSPSWPTGPLTAQTVSQTTPVFQDDTDSGAFLIREGPATAANPATGESGKPVDTVARSQLAEPPEEVAAAALPDALGSDLLANFQLGDGGALGAAVDQLLDQLHELGAGLPGVDEAAEFAWWPAPWAAALLGLELGRRLVRREDESAPEVGATAPGGALAGWPGSWSVRVP
jgi:hypothetical protein